MRIHNGDGVDSVGVSYEPVIPKVLLGFAVKVGVGPYPQDSPLSWRRAMYAELTPIEARTIEAMRRAGKERILATTPLTPRAAADIELDPDCRLAEQVGTRTLAEAARLARLVHASL